jgi:hypothetical protein
LSATFSAAAWLAEPPWAIEREPDGGVALLDSHQLDGQPQHRRHELGIRRSVALALIERLDMDRDRAVDVDLDPSSTPVLEAAHLHIGADPDPYDPSLAVRRLLVLSQAVVVGELEEPVEGGVVVAGVIHVPAHLRATRR